MDKPLVSICVPNFNNGRYLDACLRSALAQSWPNTEIILVDDASTDDSLAVAARHGERIRIVRHETNLGQPASTNQAIAEARGEYLVILHSDDQLLPDFAARLAPILMTHPEAGMAVGERLETDESGEPHGITPFYNADCLIPGERQAKVFLFMSFLPCQVLVRRTVLERIGGVDARHIVNLDGLLWFKCALAGDVAYVREPVGIYRVHGESTTAHCNRGIGHMMDYHATLSEMFRQARGRPYLEGHFDAAVKRVGQLTLRYCHSVFREGNYALASRFLSLATVFDPAIAGTHAWKALKFCADSTDKDPGELYRALSATLPAEARSFSYDPPEGFRPLADSDQVGG